MPTQFNKTLLRSMSLRVAGSWLKLAFSMDEYARLSLLEGLAGESPGKWVNKGRRGFGIAQDRFPGMHPNWTTTRDTGVYRQALAVVTKVLRSSGVTGTSPEEVLQELNMNAGTPSGPSYRRIFYTVGESNKNHGKDVALAEGKLVPNDSTIGGTINRWILQKALNVVKSQHEQLEKSVPGGGTDKKIWDDGSGQDPFSGYGTEALTHEDRMRLLLMAMKSNTSIGKRIRQIIDRGIDNYWGKADADIVRAFMEKIGDPQWSAPPKSWRQRKEDPRPEAEAWFAAVVKKIGREIMENLGVSRQRISNVLGGGAQHILKFMEKVGKSPQIEALVEAFGDEIEYLEAGPGLNLRASKRSELTPEQTPKLNPNVLQEQLEEERKNKDESEGHHTAKALRKDLLRLATASPDLRFKRMVVDLLVSP